MSQKSQIGDGKCFKQMFDANRPNDQEPCGN